VPLKPNPNNKTIKTAKLTFFIALLWLLLEDSLHHSERLDSRVLTCLHAYLWCSASDIAIVRMMRRQDVLHEDVKSIQKRVQPVR
jgi:hypothetical protein